MPALPRNEIFDLDRSEDGVAGRFFAERFGCEPIESIAQLLACSIYVDLVLPILCRREFQRLCLQSVSSVCPHAPNCSPTHVSQIQNS